METIRIWVKIGDNEAELSYPITERNAVSYDGEESTLLNSVKAIKDIINNLRDGNN